MKIKLEKDKQKTSEISNISNSKEVMNNFMKKLENNELNYEKEEDTEKALVIDDQFIEKELENYNKLLNSQVVEEAVGKKLVRKR